MSKEYEVIFAIVNEGYSSVVMDAASSSGATGGTIINARGTANPEAEQFFGIRITSEKEIIIIVILKELKDKVLHAIYKNAGMQTPGQGIAFSMPADEVVGLSEIKTTE